MTNLLHSYHLPLVLLSLLLAIFASYTVCDLTQRIQRKHPCTSNPWLLGSAVAMGTGIWAMHFLAMLALHLYEAVKYDFDVVLAALASGIFFSYLAFYLYSRGPLEKPRPLLLASLCLGLAIHSLHDIAMKGMRVMAVSHESTAVMVATCTLGTGAIYLALRLLSGGRRFWSALLLGTAITAMHYFAMIGTEFAPAPPHAPEPDIIAGEWLAVMIGIVTVSIQIVLLWSISSERQNVSRKAVRSEREFESLFNNNPDLVISLSQTGEILSLNPVCTSLMGYRPEDVIGHHFTKYVQDQDREKALHLFELALSGEPQRAVDVRVRHHDGHFLEVLVTTIPILAENGQFAGLYVVVKDITDRMAAERTIRHMAYHDALTNLPNRRRFFEELEAAIIEADQSGGKLAVLFLDLDRFKRINDSLGHNVGDQLLRHISHRLQNALKGLGIAGRFGGDEFVVLLPGVSGPEEVSLLVGGLYETVFTPVEIEEQDFLISTSIGISLYPKDGPDAVSLIKNADTAMYRAKEHRVRYQFYSDEMNAETAERLALEQDLTRALERGEFVLHYQPKVDIKTGVIHGAEALIRWYHPKKGLIPPDKFIPLAEETDLILQIGDWVLRTACEQNTRWHAAGFTDLQIAVNLSATQFGQLHLVDRVAHVLQQTGLPGRYLELEVTERVAMQESVTVIEKLQRLTELGVQISIDDFGTGYSSLSYLVKYPIHAIKMDRSFVSEVTDDSEQALVVKAILTMAHSLGLHVVAEGVEQQAQLEFLQTYNCDEYQGYFFSRPLPAQEFESLLAHHFVR
jgi:diguanylate cyclase (GGDEF)-like protein/PAS domain S-box-containing protein